jgi:hypothetical protein
MLASQTQARAPWACCVAAIKPGLSHCNGIMYCAKPRWILYRLYFAQQGSASALHGLENTIVKVSSDTSPAVDPSAAADCACMSAPAQIFRPFPGGSAQKAQYLLSKPLYYGPDPPWPGQQLQ